MSFTKGCYVGQETVARLYYRGKPNRHLRGLRLSAPAASGEEITFEGRPVGRIASAVVSPRLGPIALALIRREAPPGSGVSVGEHRPFHADQPHVGVAHQKDFRPSPNENCGQKV